MAIVKLDGVLTVDDLIVGDVVFCTRPGPLRFLCDRSSDGWTHVAIVGRTEEGLSMLEVAGDRFGSRVISADSMSKYDAIAVGRVGPSHRAAAVRAAQIVSERVGSTQIYAWDDFVLAGFIGVTRRSLKPSEAERFLHSIEHVVRAVRARPPAIRERSVTCSTLVFDAFAGGGCMLAADLTRCVDDAEIWSASELATMAPAALRAGSGSRMGLSAAYASMRAVVAGVVGFCVPAIGLDLPTGLMQPTHLARWLTPGDLWRSDTIGERFVLDVGVHN